MGLCISILVCLCFLMNMNQTQASSFRSCFGEIVIDGIYKNMNKSSFKKVVTSVLDTNQELLLNSLKPTSPSASIYSSPQWVRTLEKTDKVPQHYNIIYQADKMMGALTMDFLPEHSPPPYHLQNFLEAPSNYLSYPSWKASESLMPSLMALNRTGRICDVRFDSSIDDYTKQNVFEALLDNLENEAQTRDCKSVGFLWLSAHSSFYEILKKKNYSTALIGVRNYLDLRRIKDFNSYITEFKKSLQKNINKEQRRITQAEIHFQISHDESSVKPHVRLVQENYNKYGSQLNLDQYERRIRIFREQYGHKSFFLEMIKDEKILGSCFSLIHHSSISSRAIGIDSNFPKSLAGYFNIIYQLINYALDQKIDYVDLGTELTETKLRLGCLFEPTILAIKNPGFLLKDRLNQIDTAWRSKIAEYEFLMKSYRGQYN